MTDSVAAPAGTEGTAARRLVLVLLTGGAVAVALGVYGKVHDPTHEQPYTLFFSSTIQLKVWFATAALALAVLQVLLALRLYDKIEVPRRAPSWFGDAHRLVGTVAFVLTLPVAYQCLWALGFQSTDTRVLVHSLLGCFFYGIFTVKVLAVRVRGLPARPCRWSGGLVFVVLVGIWLTEQLVVLHVPTARVAGVLMFKKHGHRGRGAGGGRTVGVRRPALRQRARLEHRLERPPHRGRRCSPANCASCHGSDGGGGIGPQLSGGRPWSSGSPTVADEITFVRDGSGAMPAFGEQLSPAQIQSSGRVHTHTVSTDRRRA